MPSYKIESSKGFQEQGLNNMAIDFLKHHQDYPRPTLFRQGYIMLNGPWQLMFDPENIGLSKGYANGFSSQEAIVVPFAHQTIASGVNKPTTIPVIWYAKTIIFPAKDKPFLLHFEGADDALDVWINGHHLGRHEGGYVRATFTVSPSYIKEENLIVVRIEDDLRTDKPRGKQRWQKENFGCWYVETSGLWKSVWIEPVTRQHIALVRYTPNIDALSLKISVLIAEFNRPLTLAYTITYQGELIAKGQQLLMHAETSQMVSMRTPSAQFRLHYWSPQHPHLYDVSLALFEDLHQLDQVESYVGMKDIRTQGRMILLNHEPVYLKMILDQGYWPESGLTPPHFQALVDDVQLIKAMGFNGVRKHQKIEDERFYYLCDRFGLLTWLEFPSAYEFNHTMQQRFISMIPQVIDQYWNYCSIMTYVLMNESWGVPHILTNQAQQAFVDGLYMLVKSMQTGRLIVGNDGWEHVKTDLITVHNYVSTGLEMEKLYHPIAAVSKHQSPINQGYPRALFSQEYQDEGQPMIMSEYGGVALQEGQGWGYGEKVNSIQEMLTRLQGLTDAITKLPMFSGYCLTQLTDVEQEVNGLLTPQRKPKAALVDLLAIYGK